MMSVDLMGYSQLLSCVNYVRGLTQLTGGGWLLQTGEGWKSIHRMKMIMITPAFLN